MEKVLAYDRSIVAQDNGWFCGPAATQIVLDGRGIRRTESDLAKRMGTHTGGTDHIGLPARVLAAELPGASLARSCGSARERFRQQFRRQRQSLARVCPAQAVHEALWGEFRPFREHPSPPYAIEA